MLPSQSPRGRGRTPHNSVYYPELDELSGAMSNLSLDPSSQGDMPDPSRGYHIGFYPGMDPSMAYPGSCMNSLLLVSHGSTLLCDASQFPSYVSALSDRPVRFERSGLFSGNPSWFSGWLSLTGSTTPPFNETTWIPWLLCSRGKTKVSPFLML